MQSRTELLFQSCFFLPPAYTLFQISHSSVKLMLLRINTIFNVNYPGLKEIDKSDKILKTKYRVINPGYQNMLELD